MCHGRFSQIDKDDSIGQVHGWSWLNPIRVRISRKLQLLGFANSSDSHMWTRIMLHISITLVQLNNKVDGTKKLESRCSEKISDCVARVDVVSPLNVLGDLHFNVQLSKVKSENSKHTI
jgi:hypothetical protein